MVQGLHHIAIIVSDSKAIDFYRKLGFEEKQRIARPERNDEIVLMEGCGIMLEIFIDASHPARADKPENLGLRHIAFKVDDVEKLCKEFDCEEIKTDWNGVKFTFTKDPDGLPVELHE